MKEILIIEDDRLMADIYSDKLRAEGFGVQVAADGKCGLETFNSRHADLVLLDLMLPQMNGVEVLKAIRSRFNHQELPVVVFTNAYFGGMVQQAWESGANHVVTKATMTPRILTQIIKKTLDQSTSVVMSKATETRSQNGEEEFDAEVRETLLKVAPSDLATLWQPLKLLATQPSNQTALHELSEKLHPLTAKAALAGWLPISHMSGALEAFLKDLSDKPDRLTPSAILTIAQSVDTLQFLFEHHNDLKFDNLSAARILVVDDDEFTRQAVASALEKVGLRATPVDNPVSALKRRRGDHFDLIFLDIELPEANGFDLCTRLRSAEEHQRTPIVFLTMHDSHEDRIETVLSGADDFITKPFLSTELGVKALSFIIRGRNQFERAARGRNGQRARSAMFSRRDLNALKQALLGSLDGRSR